MGLLTLSEINTSQPDSSSRLIEDSSRLFAVDLRNSGREIVSGSTISKTGTISEGYDGANFSANSYVSLPVSARFGGTNFSIAVVIRPIALNGTHQMIISSLSAVTYLDVLGDKITYRQTTSNVAQSGSISIGKHIL
jgi:hypothetical protein